MLVIYDSKRASAILTGKLVEYVGSHRPILALAPEGAAAELIRKYKLGWVVGPSDISEIADRLRSLVAAWRSGELKTPVPTVSDLTAQAMAAKMALVLDQVAPTRLAATRSATQPPL